LTAGTYVAVVTGAGKTVSEAQDKAYEVAWGLKWPSNIAFRTDIGDRLKAELPKLHKLGYAQGMEF
jgi:phosphoribosylamine-glycine ligase